MEQTELAMYRGLGEVRNYGIAVLFALLVLHGGTLAALNWIESNELRHELTTYMASIPAPDESGTVNTLKLPDDILSFPMKTADRSGFYETSLEGSSYLAYADPNKHYVLMKSQMVAKKEIQSFAIALSALYVGELVLLLGWWFFIRSKVREVFEAV